MANRLTRIYTRTGDNGSTGLADGRRLAKHHARIRAGGAIDELNCQIGLLCTEPLAETHQTSLAAVQHDLFDIGAQLSLPAQALFDAGAVQRLETEIDALNRELPPLAEFILPGGARAAALAHVARAVCRRAESDLAALDAAEPLPTAVMAYVNRLSDYLFVLARTLNRACGQAEPLWHNRLSPGPGGRR